MSMMSVGDIYCVFHEPMQLYAACQVTRLKPPDSGKGSPLAAIVELDWTGDKLPEQAELQQMKPLVCDYYFWNDRIDHYYVEASVPLGYVKVGNLPPLVAEDTVTYGSWYVGESVRRQREWEQIPEALRRSFKAAAEDDTKIEVAGRQLQRSTVRIDEEWFPQPLDPSELDKLPCLTTICADAISESLLAFVNRNPFIRELHLKRTVSEAIDLSRSSLSSFTMEDAGGLKRLTLNPGCRGLNLKSSLRPDLTVEARDGGRWITLYAAEQPAAIAGLERLGSLNLTDIKELELETVVRMYPKLRELRLWGKPGTIVGMDCIERLSDLEVLTTNNLFGFTGEQFPGRDRLPRLKSLWMTSLSAEAAKSIKARYKKAAAQGFDLYIKKPRKPEWLADNLHNPFRDWDGRELISPANAKKAAELYKKTNAALSALSKLAEEGGMTAAEICEALLNLVKEYTLAFNKMDRRTGFIETVEREEIYTVLVELLQSHLSVLSAIGTESGLSDALRLFDELRDF